MLTNRCFNQATRLVTTSLLLLSASVACADWPQWRGPDRTGHVDAPPLIRSLPDQGLQPEWTFEGLKGGNSGGWSSPVIADGRVYVYAHTKTRNAEADLGPAKYPWLPPNKRVGMSEAEYEAYEVKRRDENERRAKAFRFDERLVCLDLQSGELIWDRQLESQYTRFVQSGTPCIADGRVYVLGAARTARCFDAGSGELIWEQPLSDDFRDEFFASSFAVYQDTAIVCCGPVFALNKQDGKILWQGETSLDYQSHSSPVVWQTDTPVVIVNSKGGRTLGYRLADGHKLWELQAGTGQSTPIVAENRLLTYGSSRKSGLTAFQLYPESPEKKPTELWQFRRAADSGSTPVVYNDAVFVQGDKRLAKVRLEDGNTVWQTTMRISNPRYTSLVAAGDQVFYGWEGLLAFDAKADDFEPFYKARIDSDGVLIGEEDLEKKLNLSEIRAQPEGAQKAESLWQKNAVRSGPLDCSSPAFSDGRLVIRRSNSVVCYRLDSSQAL